MLLVSSDFLNSEYISSTELVATKQRHEDKTAVVIPVLLSYCGYTNYWFSEMQGLPEGMVPLSDAEAKGKNEKSKAYTNVASKIQDLADELVKNRKSKRFEQLAKELIQDSQDCEFSKADLDTLSDEQNELELTDQQVYEIKNHILNQCRQKNQIYTRYIDTYIDYIKDQGFSLPEHCVNQLKRRQEYLKITDEECNNLQPQIEARVQEFLAKKAQEAEEAAAAAKAKLEVERQAEEERAHKAKEEAAAAAATKTEAEHREEEGREQKKDARKAQEAADDALKALAAAKEILYADRIEKQVQARKDCSESLSQPQQKLQTLFVSSAVFVQEEPRGLKRLLSPSWRIDRGLVEAKVYQQPLAKGIAITMVQIPAGSFQMGSSATEAERASDEGPQHRVELQSFFLGQTPVTQAQWQAVANWPQVELKLNPNPARFKGANRPVEQVSWEEAMEFCRRLSQRTKLFYTLPSEAQWEYACRGGTTTPFAFGDTLTSDLANYDGNFIYGSVPKGQYRQKTMEVGRFPANAWGLQDMHGNVWEWCLDHWHEDYLGSPSDGNAWVKEGDQNMRLLRGGSWLSSPGYCRSAFRYRRLLVLRYEGFGFRLCRFQQDLFLDP